MAMRASKSVIPGKPFGLQELEKLVGREEPLYTVHASVLRAAHALRPVVESGTVLAACSDEFNGDLRSAFERSVARVLVAPNVPGGRRVFAVSNLGGRIEPGAIALADLHFTALSRARGTKLLLIEIASHVGRRETKQGVVWGELDRFGNPSPCCGALQVLLQPTPSVSAVRFPWFDQLTAFFGDERLQVLRSDASPWRMVRAAVVHAVLQAETAIVDLLREPPTTPTHVLLVALVVVNRPGQDRAIAVGVHHLSFEGDVPRFRLGTSLRSTPGAIEIEERGGLLRITSPFGPEREGRPQTSGELPVAPALASAAETAAVQAHVARARGEVRALAAQPHGLRVYARPLLRAFLQGLSVIAPEVGLAGLALEVGRDVFRADRLRKLVASGPSTAAARAALHDLEPTIQQLSHAEAREVLEILLHEEHPLLGRPA